VPVTVGSSLPEVDLWVVGADGRPVAVPCGHLLGRGRVVLIGVPGAFTPGCSKVHLPGFVHRYTEVVERGVDRLACVSVNDAWVMDAWGRDQGVGEDLLMLGDPTGDFTGALGLLTDRSEVGLGMRSRRYVAVLEHGVFTRLDVESGPGVSVSSCDALLEHL
jgi:glutaredoxin/glutathione-dependent peroxiredoxin